MHAWLAMMTHESIQAPCHNHGQMPAIYNSRPFIHYCNTTQSIFFKTFTTVTNPISLMIDIPYLFVMGDIMSVSLWPSEAIWRQPIRVKIGSGNGLLPDGTKPLPKPMLTYHKRHSVAFAWQQVYKCSWTSCRLAGAKPLSGSMLEYC